MPQDDLTKLRALIRDLQSVVVAYSGGVDSALVLAVAHEQLGTRALGVTAVSPSLPSRELQAAISLARDLGAQHRCIHSGEMRSPEYRRNDRDRCYFCKQALYNHLVDLAAREGYAHVVNGTNHDDLGDDRPGLQAASEHQVRSPLLELGLDKAAVRKLAHTLDLPCWNKPASACLSSRIPYGTPVNQERLTQVERLEDALLALGLTQLRVRHHGPVARIEVLEAELQHALATREAIVEASLRAGFTFAALDLCGYRSGSMNRLPLLP